jgi:uncharacterized low-complexity protein
MNSALKHTIIALATAALSVTAACKSDEGPDAAEATAGAEAATADADAAAAEAEEAAGDAEEAAGDAEEAAEASCGEGSCG